VVDLPEHIIADFCSRFSAERYNLDADMMRTTFSLKDHAGMGMYSFIDSEVGLKVDLFPLRHNDPAQEFALSRRVLEEIAEGVRAYVYTAEDLLVQKLRWYAQSESQRQFRDCVSLLLSDQNRADPLISLDYVGNWANKLGVEVQTAWTQLLAAIRQAGSPRAG
jgi:hypothetical protein